MDDVIVHIPEKQPGLRGDDVAFIPGETAQHLAQRPDRLAQHEHLALEMMDAGQRRRGRIGDQLVFERLDLVSEVLEQGEVVIYHRIEQRVGKIIGLHEPNPAACVEPLAHPVEDVPGHFLQRQDEPVGEDQA